MPTNQPKRRLNSAELNQVATLRTVNVAQRSFTENSVVRLQLPQTGLGSRLFITVDGQVTFTPSSGTMTITGGTWAGPANYAPYSVLRNINLQTNNGITYANLSGFSNYLLERYRSGKDPMGWDFSRWVNQNSQLVGTNIALNTNIAATTPAYYGAYGGQPVITQSTTLAVNFPVRFTTCLDLTYNRRGDTGYIVLQQNNVFTNLELTIANLVTGISATGGSTDLFTGLTGTNIVPSFTGNLSVDLEYRDVPDLSIYDISDMLGSFRSVLESQNPLVSGQNSIQVPQQDFVTMLVTHAWNNGAPLDVRRLQNPTLNHSSNVNIQQMSPQGMTARTLRDTGMAPVDGTLVWDLGASNGLLAQRDIADAIDNRFITDLRAVFNLDPTVTPTGSNGVMLITEALRPVIQG